MYEPTDVITTEDEIRSVIPNQFTSQTGKIIDYIDEHIRVWIERSPFLTITTYSASGQVEISPKGDPAGFVKVLDEKTFAIPEMSGASQNMRSKMGSAEARFSSLIRNCVPASDLMHIPPCAL